MDVKVTIKDSPIVQFSYSAGSYTFINKMPTTNQHKTLMETGILGILSKNTPSMYTVIFNMMPKGLLRVSSYMRIGQGQLINKSYNFDQDRPVAVKICKSEMAQCSRIECSFNSSSIVSIPGAVASKSYTKESN